jgi:hypothetical protein
LPIDYAAEITLITPLPTPASAAIFAAISRQIFFFRLLSSISDAFSRHTADYFRRH